MPGKKVKSKKKKFHIQLNLEKKNLKNILQKNLIGAQQVRGKGIILSLFATSYFFFIFFPNQGDRILVVKEKTHEPINFLSSLFFQSNTYKISFFSTFLSSIFYHSCFTQPIRPLHPPKTQKGCIEQRNVRVEVLYPNLIDYVMFVGVRCVDECKSGSMISQFD